MTDELRWNVPPVRPRNFTARSDDRTHQQELSTTEGPLSESRPALTLARRDIVYFALRVYLISTPFHSGTVPKLR